MPTAMTMASPTNPYLVLVGSLVPGAGHVLLGLPQRGLTFLFFTVVLGWVSLRIMPADLSFFSRHAGGFLIYGISILDAYKMARIRWAEFQAKTKNE